MFCFLSGYFSGPEKFSTTSSGKESISSQRYYKILNAITIFEQT